jgi:hypothetical protein
MRSGSSPVSVSFLPAGCDAISTEACTGFQMRGLDGVPNNALMYRMLMTRWNSNAWTAFYPLYRVELTNMGLAMAQNVSFPVVTVDGTLSASPASRIGLQVRLPFRFHLAWTLGYPAVTNNAGIFRVAYDPVPLTFVNSGNVYNFSVAGFLPWAREAVGVMAAPALSAVSGPVQSRVQPLFSNQTQEINTTAVRSITAASAADVALPNSGWLGGPSPSVYVPLLQVSGRRWIQHNGGIAAAGI